MLSFIFIFWFRLLQSIYKIKPHKKKLKYISFNEVTMVLNKINVIASKQISY
jgi:hypothetical protein